MHISPRVFLIPIFLRAEHVAGHVEKYRHESKFDAFCAFSRQLSIGSYGCNPWQFRRNKRRLPYSDIILEKIDKAILLKRLNDCLWYFAFDLTNFWNHVTIWSSLNLVLSRQNWGRREQIVMTFEAHLVLDWCGIQYCTLPITSMSWGLR